jgi:hypothetical protein
VRCQLKWQKAHGGGTHRERVNGGAAAPNLACSVVDSSCGVVKWHLRGSETAAGAQFR